MRARAERYRFQLSLRLDVYNPAYDYRSDNRSPEQMRPVNVIPGFISTAEGSCLIEIGNTRVICTATIEDTVPQFLRNSGKGWVTASTVCCPARP